MPETFAGGCRTTAPSPAAAMVIGLPKVPNANEKFCESMTLLEPVYVPPWIRMVSFGATHPKAPASVSLGVLAFCAAEQELLSLPVSATWYVATRLAPPLGLHRGDYGARDVLLGEYLLRAEVLAQSRHLLQEQWAKHTQLLEEGSDCPWVFPYKGQRFKSFKTAWKTACRNAGLTARIAHDFRRTAVRNLTRAGIVEDVAMQMTGHLTRSVFERYNIVNRRDLEHAKAILDSRSGTTSGTKTLEAVDPEVDVKMN